MRKTFILLFFFVLAFNCYSQNMMKFPVEMKYLYLENYYEKPQIVDMFISKKDKNFYLVSGEKTNKIFVNDDSYSVTIKSDEIQYSESFLLGRPGARYVKITPIDGLIKLDKYNVKKYNLDLPEFQMIIFIDESSKINNTSFLNNKYGILSPPELPKGLIVRVDIKVSERVFENVWLLQNINTDSNKVLSVNIKRVESLERNLKREFGEIKVIAK